jgi:hypothetical protein
MASARPISPLELFSNFGRRHPGQDDFLQSTRTNDYSPFADQSQSAESADFNEPWWEFRKSV